MFVSILMFGYNKLSTINETISQNELLEIQNNVKKVLESCDDSLNRGNKVFIKIGSKIKKICFLGNTPTSDNQLKTIYDSGDNVVLFGNSNEILNSFNVENIIPISGNEIICKERNDKDQIDIVCK
jgi:hypothetical protein